MDTQKRPWGYIEPDDCERSLVLYKTATDPLCAGMSPANPGSEDDIVSTIAELVGDRTGVVVMHACEALGSGMGDENVKYLPQTVLDGLSERLETEVSLVPENMTVCAYGKGLGSSTGDCPLPGYGSATATIGRTEYEYSAVGCLDHQLFHPELWGQPIAMCVGGRGHQVRTWIQFRVDDYHPWDSTVPLLALFVKPRPTAQSRAKETLEQTQKRQAKKFKSLFGSR